MKYIQGNSREQIQMLCLDDYITKENPVRFIDAFVNKLEIDKIGIKQQISDKQKKSDANIGGAPRYDPTMLLKLYLYGYLNKIRSSRKLEQECGRNIELRWLMHEIIPNYHSIADFRKQYPHALKALFKLYVQFMCEAGLIGKETVALDGTKFRAVNSKKNNYNQKKIDKYMSMIEEKATTYLKQLEELDKQESTTDKTVLAKEKMREGLQQLKERKIKYEALQIELDATKEKQISTTDPESRALIINKNIVEVAYNTQCVVDDKHCLIIHTEATNSNDSQALLEHTNKAVQNVGTNKITVLADKGYYTGEQIHGCHENHIQTFVAPRDQASAEHIEDPFLIENFRYNKKQHSYTCPAGKTLTTTGTWHLKKRENGETRYRFQSFTTSDCESCALRLDCTSLKRRAIHRSEFQDAVDMNNKIIKKSPEVYKRRQAIVEHPFGTIKRQWGYSYTLLKGLRKVNGEMNLIMLCYNIRRTFTILGFEKLLQRINTWTPDYSKVLCSYFLAFIEGIFNLNQSPMFWLRFSDAKNRPSYSASVCFYQQAIVHLGR